MKNKAKYMILFQDNTKRHYQTLEAACDQLEADEALNCNEFFTGDLNQCEASAYWLYDFAQTPYGETVAVIQYQPWMENHPEFA